MQSKPWRCTAPCGACGWEPGGSSAAIHGEPPGMTPYRNGRRTDVRAALRRPRRRNELLLHHHPELRHRDHGAHGVGDGCHHAPHGQEHALHDADAAPAAGDEADPGEVQERPREAQCGVDGVLQGEQDQPAGWLPAADRPDACVHHHVPADERPHGAPGWPGYRARPDIGPGDPGASVDPLRVHGPELRPLTPEPGH